MFLLTNRHLERDVVINRHSESDVVTNRHSESDVVTNRHSESDVVTNRHSESDVVTNRHSERDVVTNRHSERDVVTNRHSKRDVVTNRHSESDVVTNRHSERDVVTNRHSERDVVTNGHSERDVVTNRHSESDVVTNRHSERDVVTNRHSERDVVTNGHSERDVVTNRHSERDVVTNGHSERDVVTNRHSERDVAHPNPTSNWSARLLEVLHIPNVMEQEVPNMPLDYYTCQFKKSKLERFLGSDNRNEFFEDTHRHRILWEMLTTTTYGKKKRAEVGIERLIDESGFVAAFPLHDGPYECHHDLSPEELNKRQVLYKYWARWGVWYKYQPLDHIREYFGEKIGIYFAWLGFYTAWLLPASIVGVLVFLYGFITFNDNIPANEVCDSGQLYKMCPVCDEDIGCEYWFLSDVCLFVKISYLFDHPGTVFYAVFVSFWAVTFLEYWKRKNASLSHHWDCLDFEEEELLSSEKKRRALQRIPLGDDALVQERPRPDYAARATDVKENPITGINEPYFDPRKRLPRILSGVAAIIIMMFLVLIFIVAVIMYRVLISIPLFENKDLRPKASTIASMSAAVVNLVIIMTLGRVYEKLALKLTQWEMHRTQTEFEDQLTFKVFVFQFVNFYSSIIYIAFFKGKFVGYPGHYNTFFGLRSEECNNGGCLIELAQQLGVIMIGKQIINNAQEIIVPKLKGFWHRFQTKLKKTVQRTRWEDDYDLIENEGLFQEYLEMVLQFGFITIFVAAFPLAPLFALLNNWVEIRLDAHKFICETRRPVAERAQDIGVWFIILESLAQLAVISNAFLIAFTSEFLPRLVYKYQYQWTLHGYTNFTLAMAPNNTLNSTCRYRDFRDVDGNHTMFYWKLLTVRLAFVIVFEHVVFGICKLIDILVPDVPEILELKIKRERYLAKQALADTDTIMMMARRNDIEEEEVEPKGVDVASSGASHA